MILHLLEECIELVDLFIDKKLRLSLFATLMSLLIRLDFFHGGEDPIVVRRWSVYVQECFFFLLVKMLLKLPMILQLVEELILQFLDAHQLVLVFYNVPQHGDQLGEILNWLHLVQVKVGLLAFTFNATRLATVHINLVGNLVQSFVIVPTFFCLFV